MQLSVMRSEARLIFGQPDTTNSNFTEAQLNTWANEFYRYACMELTSVPITERTYTTGATITLNSNTITVDKAKIKAQPANQWQELEIIDLSDLYAIDPNWENATTGIPEFLVRTGTFTARLYPGPNSANDAQASSLKTHGLEMPSDLSADADTPDLPLNIHDLFPHWIAYRAFGRLEKLENARGELIVVQGILKQQKLMSTKFSNGRGWKWPGVVTQPDRID